MSKTRRQILIEEAKAFLPSQPIPSWLNPKMEVMWWKEDGTSQESFNQFLMASFNSLRGVAPTIPLKSIVEVLSNSMVETGRGARAVGHNLGGWKLRKQGATQETRFWRAPGHVASGDEAVCYYQVFDSDAAFYQTWLTKFVPKETSEKRYKECGKLFHEGKDWFPALIQGGYKGEVTKANPDASIRSHQAMTNEMCVRLVQMLAGIADKSVDGDWGAGTSAAVKAKLGKDMKDDKPFEALSLLLKQ